MSATQLKAHTRNVHQSHARKRFYQETLQVSKWPDADEIAKLLEMDPTIIDWLKVRTEREMDFRQRVITSKMEIRKHREANLRAVRVLGAVFIFCLAMAGIQVCRKVCGA
jgi:hypothetical protein